MLQKAPYPPRRDHLKDLTVFSLKEIQRKLNSINIQINLEHQETFSMTKIKDDAIELMPEYLMIGFPVRLTFLISKNELAQRSLMRSFIS